MSGNFIWSTKRWYGSRQSINFNRLWFDVHVSWTKYLECWVDEWQHCVLQFSNIWGIYCCKEMGGVDRRPCYYHVQKISTIEKGRSWFCSTNQHIVEGLSSHPWTPFLSCFISNVDPISLINISFVGTYHTQTTFFTSICKFHQNYQNNLTIFKTWSSLLSWHVFRVILQLLIPISVCYNLKLCNAIFIYWGCNNLPNKVIYVLQCPNNLLNFC